MTRNNASDFPKHVANHVFQGSPPHRIWCTMLHFIAKADQCSFGMASFGLLIHVVFSCPLFLSLSLSLSLYLSLDLSLSLSGIEVCSPCWAWLCHTAGQRCSLLVGKCDLPLSLQCMGAEHQRRVQLPVATDFACPRVHLLGALRVLLHHEPERGEG